MSRMAFLIGILMLAFVTESVSEPEETSSADGTEMIDDSYVPEVESDPESETDSDAAAADPVDTPAAVKGIEFSGMGSMEFGQLIEYQWRGDDHKRAWLSQVKVQLCAKKMITSWLDVSLGLEGAAWYETYDKFSNNPFVRPERFYTFLVHESKARFSWGDPLTLEVGLFPYKYSNDVTNLGEYLFRTGTYPPFIVGEFDFPMARVTGIRVNNKLFDKVDQDLLVTMEEEFKPFHDITLTYIGDVAPHPAIHIGAGVQLARLFSVDEAETTPGQRPDMEDTWYIANPDTIRDVNGNDSLILGDTINVSFRGVKVMARVSFDVKKFFDWPIFGPEDLKLYAEAAILGVKDYQLLFEDRMCYDTLTQRIPVMVGFNLPTFKILDVLSFEVEYYGWPFPNNYKNASAVIQPGPRPIPDQREGSYADDYYDYSKDNWKWSVYARKTIAESFSATLQFARDHFRTKSDNPYNMEREESLTKDEHWYWIAKLSYRF